MAPKCKAICHELILTGCRLHCPKNCSENSCGTSYRQSVLTGFRHCTVPQSRILHCSTVLQSTNLALCRQCNVSQSTVPLPASTVSTGNCLLSARDDGIITSNTGNQTSQWHWWHWHFAWFSSNEVERPETNMTHIYWHINVLMTDCWLTSHYCRHVLLILSDTCSADICLTDICLYCNTEFIILSGEYHRQLPYVLLICVLLTNILLRLTFC